MGEVYRARDTRLGRDVAIKILALHVNASREGRERFDREARAISKLSHPNVCVLYDVGHQDGTDYLVMEFLQGETLAERLSRGPLPLKDLIRFGSEMAEALAKAHDEGLVHRDLKPGNVMLTKTGAKILDFGLAKCAATATHEAELSVTETAQKSITEEGTILGTIPYMAPEQLEGKESDARTDIFAYGAILYEMATGRRAFTGRTKASLITAIMDHDPPPISTFQPMTPPAVDRLVRACLEKDPDQRWQSAHDAAHALRWIGGERAQKVVRVGPRLAVLLVLSAIALIASLAGFFAVRVTASKARPEIIRFTIEPGVDHTIGSIAVSPDGTAIAYDTFDLDLRKSTTWVESFSAREPRKLVETVQGTKLFWSPDGTRVAFSADGKLQAAHIRTGAIQTICDVAGQVGYGTWGNKGTLLFEAQGSIFRVSEHGGEPTLVLSPKGEDMAHSFPTFLSDGQRFLFFRRSQNRARQGVYLASLAEPLMERRLFESNFATPATYVASGYLLYQSSDMLLARGFDPKRGAARGDPIVLAEGIDPRTTYSVSVSGSLAYQIAPVPAVEQIVVVDRSGKERRTIGPRGALWHVALAPDERSLSLEIGDQRVGTTDIWLVNLDTHVLARLTFEPYWDWQMVWSQKGRELFFASNRHDNSDVYAMTLVPGSAPRLIYRDAFMQAPLDVSPDGKFLLLYHWGENSSGDLIAVPLGGGEPVRVADSTFTERAARFSPNGRWVAYDSNESGDRQVFLQSFPTASTKFQISTAGGMTPAWRRDGRELYYVSPQGELWAVEIHPDGNEIRPSRPSILFRLERSVAMTSIGRYAYAPAKNGAEFYVRKQLSPGRQRPVQVVLNATADLDR